MTGTGTQADPFIVDNWADFVTAIGTSSAYVEFAEDTVIDMDDDYSTGISSTININCTQIDGKGSIIKNLYLTGGAYFYFQSSFTLKNINLLDMRREYNSGFTFSFYTSGTFLNCAISGSFCGGAMFRADDSNSYLSCCSVTAQLQAGCKFAENGYYNDSRCLHISNSNVKIEGNPALSDRSLVLNNTMLCGKLPTRYFYRIDSSIIDCDVPDNTAVTASYSKGYINSDLFGTGVTVDSHFTALTDAQIHDAGYLFSIGFPIGVD